MRLAVAEVRIVGCTVRTQHICRRGCYSAGSYVAVDWLVVDIAMGSRLALRQAVPVDSSGPCC